MADTKSQKTMDTGSKTEEKSKTNEDKKEQELSEEDVQLVNELNLLVDILKESNEDLYRQALETLRGHIRSSTTSMTSVPKPLKFLRPHFNSLKDAYDKINNVETKRFCADVLSVLSMTMSETRECLKFRMLGSLEPIGSWGHEYVRHLTGEIAQEWQELEGRDEKKQERDDLLKLIHDVVPYLMQHNAEPEACDILMEVEKLEFLEQYVDKAAYPRVCLYLRSCVPYVPDPENTNLLRTALGIYRKFDQFADALFVAIHLNNIDLIKEIYNSCLDKAKRKQMACILARQQIYFALDESDPDQAEEAELMRNVQLNSHFLSLARELDIMDPKMPEDIYKSHLEPNRPTIGQGSIDSARQNLSASFVNGLVNAAFGKDKLMAEQKSDWLYKNKEHGMMSAAASLGLILLWDIEGGLSQLDKYLYSKEDYIKAGSLLGCGIVNSGVRNECDPAFALLSDYVMHGSMTMRLGSILGLGLAYAGSNRQDVLNVLLHVFPDPKSSMEVLGVASIACGMVAVGSCNGQVNTVLLQTLMEKTEAELKDTYLRFCALGLGLVFLGRQEGAEATLAALEVIPEPYRSMAITLVDVCAYAGTGNVLKVQALLHACSEHYDVKDQENNERKEDKNKKKDSKTKKKKVPTATLR